MALVKTGGIEWGAAERSHDGTIPSGDVWTALRTAYGTLVAVADGLGRGPEAASVARAAAALLERDRGRPLPELFRRCHESLRGTRGVVMSLAAFHTKHRTMTWAGVGNVEGILLRADPGSIPARESLLLRSGVLGHRLPPLAPEVLSVYPGDTLVLASDGVRWVPDLGSAKGETPAAMARRILERHATGLDDAVVLVARCREDGT